MVVVVIGVIVMVIVMVIGRGVVVEVVIVEIVENSDISYTRTNYWEQVKEAAHGDQ